MDPVESYDAVVRLVANANEPRAAWRDFVQFVAAQVGEKSSAPLRNVDPELEVKVVREQLATLFEREPPSTEIDTFYFGLFDALGPDETEEIGFYVSGIQGFDPENGDSLCDPAWWPDGRYLESDALASVKAGELRAAAADCQEERTFLGYAGQLGAALIVSRFSVAGLAGGRRIVVGFDSGDFVELSPGGQRRETDV
jgi:hypothetical protein